MTAKILEDIRNWFWPVDATEAGAEPAPDGGPDLDRARRQPHALIVDDEVAICQSVSLILSTLGIEAESAHTAQQALSALARRLPSIIFLDVQLKKSDAIDVIRGLGAANYRGVVQLMSGSNADLLEDVRRVGARHGLDMRPALGKPFRAEAVRQAIATVGLQRTPAVPVGLDEALANGWLELWYQPKIDLRSKTLAGAEGLIRCQHPAYGMLGPASFLPGASAASLAALTELVVITALRDWDALAAIGVNLHTAVNTSIGALTNMNLPALIREYRPNRERWPGLILEVTEEEVVKDVALMHEIATQLRIYGITFAIDDFGEGYSSFARLRELPFAELKLDRSFVHDCASNKQNAGICRAIIDLAHHFGAVAVAEGLENPADLQAIHRMGCDMGQGFLLARPMPKGQLVAMLQQRAMQQEAS
jgi:EAL domain-containing protein (putative c-di-GMP-specific phosphodiesterase class I)/ActR/RegA family two-component response regulator